MYVNQRLTISRSETVLLLLFSPLLVSDVSFGAFVNFECADNIEFH